jgi:ABC-2 type transport system permease protein
VGTVIATLIRAEFRKTVSVKLWWALLIPVVLVGVLVNAFGGLFTAALTGAGSPSLLPVSLAYSLSLTSIFAVLYGIVTVAGEFRHRTITTSYLQARGRGWLLTAKSVAAAGVGAVYAVGAALAGVPAGLLGGSRAPGVGSVLAVVVIGMVVSALWAVLGTALGTVMSNQVVALIVALVYLLLGELLLSSLLTRAGSPTAARLTSYLPGNAGDIALYEFPARGLVGDEYRQVVELLAGVSAPPPWWGALIVLAFWTAAAAASAWVVGDRRDVT